MHEVDIDTLRGPIKVLVGYKNPRAFKFSDELFVVTCVREEGSIVTHFLQGDRAHLLSMNERQKAVRAVTSLLLRERFYALFLDPDGYDEENPSKVELIMLPGHYLSRALRYLLPNKKYDLYIEPVISDEHEEYIEAMSGKNHAKTRWIRLRTWILVAVNLIAILPGIFLTRLHKLIGG